MTVRRIFRTTAGFASTLLVVMIAVGYATSPVFWRVSSQDEFLRGEVEQVSVDADGQLVIGPPNELVYEATVPFLWSLTQINESLWVGSGNDGRVFRIAPDGTVTTAYDAAEQNIHAIAADGNNAAYIGTSPQGALLRVTANTAETIFDPPEQYIWAIAVAQDKTVFIGTGGTGRIYSLSPSGESSLFYDTGAAHVLSLTFDRQDNLLASTGAPGRILRITREGKPFVLLESPLAEIRSLRAKPNGTLYAVAVNQSPSGGGMTLASSNSSSTPTVSTSTSVTTVTSADPTPNTQSSRPKFSNDVSPGDKGAVYRVQPDGTWDVIWRSAVDAPYDVAFNATEDLVIGTGNRGKIFQVTEDPPRVVLLTRAPAEQVTSLFAGTDGTIYYVTANPGKVFRLPSRRAKLGAYLSEVRDTQTTTTWGTIRWRAATPGDASVRLFTRSGNTVTPNNTWSSWSDPYTNQNGAQITSPKARYIQWRAELGGSQSGPTLFSVTTAYLPRNLKPEITQLTVYDPGVVFQRPFSSGDPPIAGVDEGTEARRADMTAPSAESQSSALGRQVYRKGLQTLIWDARDPNSDRLQFEVLYRSETDSQWHLLRHRLNSSIFTWDTSSTPDGTYVVRVVASDKPSNVQGTALQGAAESTPFNIDNSPPRVNISAVATGPEGSRVLFTVTDSHSAVQHVEYSLDTEIWEIIHPIDGIPDSLEEKFEISLSPTDVSRLIIRATDAMDNTVTASGQP